MFSGVVRDFHGIHLQALRAFTNVVDPGDVGTLFTYHLHHLGDRDKKKQVNYQLIRHNTICYRSEWKTDLSHLLVVVVSEVQVV